MAFYACGSDDSDILSGSSANVNANDASIQSAVARLEFPKLKKDSCELLIHTTNDAWGINYCVEWDKEKKAQRWSCYQLNSATLTKGTTRYYSKENQYPMDPQLSATDYPSRDFFYGSGFDHGHICPSADRLYTPEANRQTFFLTNMQPQYSNFNGSNNSASINECSPWYRLESQVRSWANATTTEMLYVVKGGTIDDDKIIKKIGGELRVPQYFFVALLLKNAQGYKAVGFWMKHESSYAAQEPMSTYTVNIRQLEKLTGIDFFCNLPDDIEEHVETLPVENVIRAWGI
jgi:endonuclease G